MKRLDRIPFFGRKSLALAAALNFAACAEDSSTPDTDGQAAGEALSIVEPGKEDNFFSVSAQEYLLTGTTTVQLEASYAGRSYEERLKRAQALVPYRQTVIGWFLNAYMIEKSDKDENKDHGGFKALTKNGSWEDLDLREVDELTFAFDLRQEIAGPLNLLDVLPTKVGEDGKRRFELTMGRISTAEMQRLDYNNEWYRKSPWGSFNPANLTPDRLETIELAIEAEPRSADAWFDYPRLIEDGVLDIGVHFGWDYHKEYHLVHSRSIYEWLVREGFKSPVASYDALLRDSGPLTKTVQTPEGAVELRVSLFWGKPGSATDPDTDAGGRALEEDMRASLKNRDVIVFSGHSGPFYGFALANWRKTDEGDLDDSELETVEMPAGRYQVVLAEGCDTYAQGQAFFNNPAKADREHLDIITTTSFSNAGTDATVRDFLRAFVELDAAGVPKAPTLSELLQDLDSNSFWFTTMYGVHGIDDNLRRHPWANEAALCEWCIVDSDCGASGNKCVALADGQKACTFQCTGDEGCPDGFVCQAAQSGGWIRSNVCVTRNATCEVQREQPIDVRIAEVVPNPDRDLNGDGVFNVVADEAVTLTNKGATAANLSGWALADNVGVRFTFPQGFQLLPGQQVTVYGGGTAEWVAPRSLGLNNAGDTVRLLDDRGATRDQVSWRNARPGAVVIGG